MLKREGERESAVEDEHLWSRQIISHLLLKNSGWISHPT